MLLGTQNWPKNYLGSRLSNHIRDKDMVLDANIPLQQSPTPSHSPQSQASPTFQHKEKMDFQSPNNMNGLKKSEIKADETKVRFGSNGSMSTSSFSIDSILATKPMDIKLEYNSRSDSRSPSNSPSHGTPISPIRPTRVPAIIHPGLHLSHLAAAAATGFSTPSDFLGKLNSIENINKIFFERVFICGSASSLSRAHR